MIFQIPGWNNILEVKTIILDWNGTLAVGGQIVEGVKERLSKLIEQGYQLVLFSGDTRGNAAQIAADLGLAFIKAGTQEEKAFEAAKLNPETCAAIGNGLIDLQKMKTVKLKIVTLQAEGVHTQTLLASDIVVPSINDALDLFLDANRLIATLRK